MNLILGYNGKAANVCRTGAEVVSFGLWYDDIVRETMDRIERENPNLEIVAVRWASLPGSATDE
jgi:hypothetical protein